MRKSGKFNCDENKQT